ncbi:flagellinolysin [Comamonas terrigena]|uniref:flagellinolysin n=1 Tax=Comamonas terrigena TaxID=32013 RepID=UPI0028A971C5|nr:flagellinolysin [Comamonas terrigena]
MALSISTNIASLNAQRSLSHSQAGLSTTMQRLSSGLRVNSAKDDAAGLAISERMFSQVRGMQQAARNANDGISMLQTAEGSISKVGDMLQRMRELAVQSINFTNSDQDRQALQGEVAQLKREIDRIGISSQFNGEYIFAPSRTKVVGSGDPSIEAAIDGLQGGWLENAEAMIKQYFGIEATGQTIKFEFTDSIDGAGGVAARVWSSVGASGPGSNIRMELDMADFTSSTSLDGGSGPVYYDRIIAHEMTHAIMATGQSWGELRSDTSNLWFIEGAAEFIHGGDERIASHPINDIVNDDLTAWGSSSLDYASGYAAVRYIHEEIKAAGGAGISDVLQALQTTPGLTLDAALATYSHGAFADRADFYSKYNADKAAFIASFDLGNTDVGAVGGADVDGGPAMSPENVVNSVGTHSGEDALAGFVEDWGDAVKGSRGDYGRTLGFQVGANSGDYVYAKVGSMNLGAMGLEDLDISTAAGATKALRRIDQALDYANGQRTKIGAQMSRFDSIVAHLQTSTEHLSASRGRIVDADYAQETAALSRTLILQKVGTAMVAQANQRPQSVLALLG